MPKKSGEEEVVKTTNPLNRRLIEIFTDYGFNQSRAAAFVGVSRPLINEIYNTEADANEKVVIRTILSCQQYNPEWIVYGTGSKMRAGQPGQQKAFTPTGNKNVNTNTNNITVGGNVRNKLGKQE